MRSGGSWRQRAAASSIASGIPSSCWQMSTTACICTALKRMSGRARRARSRNSGSRRTRRAHRHRRRRRAPAPPATARATSPRRTARAARGSSPARRGSDTTARSDSIAAAASATRCSQLSNTTSAGAPASRSLATSMAGRAPSSFAPIAASSVDPIARGSRNGARSTHHTPPGNRSSRSAPTRAASLVLPTPPEPVSVTSRSRPSSSAERGELGDAADQRCRLGRQVVAVRVEGPQRPVDDDEIRVREQPQLLRPIEVLQPVSARRRRARRPCGNAPAATAAALARHEDLSAVRPRCGSALSG